MSDILQSLANMATVFALLWAMYEFIYKRRTIVKATGRISPIGKTLIIDIYNGSSDKPITIDSVCIEVAGWNSRAECFQIEKVNVHPYEDAQIDFDLTKAVENLRSYCKKRSIFGKKIRLYLITTSQDTIPVHIDEYQAQLLKKLMENGHA